MIDFIFNVSKSFNESSGTKTLSLSRVKEMGINVPALWSVNCEEFERFIREFDIMPIEQFLSLDSFDDSQVKLIREAKKHIGINFDGDSKGRYIARSSSVPKSIIHNYASMISGAFESYECTSDNLAQSIVAVYESLYSEKAFLQLKLAGLEKNIRGMAVLVQEFVVPECSGVLHAYKGDSFMEVNWVQGHLRSIVSGDTSGDYDVIYEKNGEIIVRGKEQHIYCIIENGYSGAFMELYGISSKLLERAQTDLEIEWIYRDGKIYIVQNQELIRI